MNDSKRAVIELYTMLDLFLHDEAFQQNYRFVLEDTWSTDIKLSDLTLTAEVFAQRYDESKLMAQVYRWDSRGFALISLRNDKISIKIFAVSTVAAFSILEEIKNIAPVVAPSSGNIKVTFWNLGPHGPVSTARMLEAPQWNAVSTNYSSITRESLENLLVAKPDPVHGGKLILWHGAPGTGKTYALRAMAQMWKDWAEFHYVIDPENFFGKQSSYMTEVLLADSEWIDDNNQDLGRRWRVIIAEDTGELLSRDAKYTAGQSLSRLLNICDGLVGQGLRNLVLITTNEQVGEMHPAVIRPGRCLANVEFTSLDAREWFIDHDMNDTIVDQSSMTLAELYAISAHSQPIITRERVKVGF